MHRNDTCSVMLIYMQKWCLMLGNIAKHPMNGQWIAHAYMSVYFFLSVKKRKRESDEASVYMVGSIHTYIHKYICRYRVDQLLFSLNFYKNHLYIPTINYHLNINLYRFFFCEHCPVNIIKTKWAKSMHFLSQCMTIL